MRITFILSFLILCLASCTSENDHLTEAENAPIDRILVSDVPYGAPGLAIGIVRNGSIIYEEYAGYASLSDSARIGPNTRFNIASNGKQFTALTVLHLVYQNKLSLEDDIRDYFPALYPEVIYPITIRHLLTHTSGIRDYYGIVSLKGKRWWQFTSDNGVVLKFLEDQGDLNFEPGSRYLYSNTNYILLAEISAIASKTSFTALTDELFEDLGMPSTAFEDNYATITGEIAQPYFNFDTWSSYSWINNIVGDGALFSTLKDQLSWEIKIQTQKSYPLSADVIEMSQRPVVGSEFGNYGYGVEFGEYRGEKLLYHTGATGAWKAVTYRFPGKNIAIVTLTNSGKILPEMTTKAVADILLGKDQASVGFQLEPEQAGSRVDIQDVIGIYQTENGFTFQFAEIDGDLYLLRDGRNDTRLIRESANVFQQWNDSSFKLEFIRYSDPAMVVTAYHTSHAPYSLKRVEADFAGFDFEKLNGSFVNEETSVRIEITHIAGQNFNVNLPGGEYTGLLLKPDLLKVNQYTLQFSDIQGENEFLLDGDRIKKVAFTRLN